MAGAYATFLETTDLETWRDCLRTLSQKLDQNSGDQDLRQVVFVCMFVAWLSRVCCEFDLESDALSTLEQATAALISLHRSKPSGQTKLAVAALMAWRGYKEEARASIADVSPLPPEAALLLVPENRARAAAYLRKVRETAPTPLMAYFYADALLTLGNSKRAKAVLKSSSLAPDDPMRLDIDGRIAEQSGHWRAANDLYRKSKNKWPSHAVRAVLAAVVAGLETDDADERVLDDAIRRRLLNEGSEIDRAELARWSSFVATCRRKKFDHWFVHFKLAQLEFRRRRYSTADANYQRALMQCPDSAMFPVLSARFSNLTWLQGISPSLSITPEPEPEVLECGYAAYKAADEENKEEAASIWVWLASTDKSLLSEVPEAAEDYTLSRIKSLIGDEAGAIGHRLRTLERNYMPRVIRSLIIDLATCKFAGSVGWLIDLVIRESADDFFSLWELGGDLVALRGRRDLTAARIDHKIELISARLDELSRHEFQHLMRAYEFYREAGRLDRALNTLNRASALSEGPEEDLAIATARREIFGPDQAFDPRFLRRAERESGERFMRLKIAHEAFRQGEINMGRRILESAGVFGSQGDLEPAEYILVLSCLKWLTNEESHTLVKQAVDALHRDTRNSVFDRYAPRFRERLRLQVGIGRLITKEEFELDPWLLTPTDDGSAGSNSVAVDDDILSKPFRNQASTPLGEKLYRWKVVSKQLDAALAEVTATRPDVEAANTPINKAADLNSDWRSQELTDMWRDYFFADGVRFSEAKLHSIRRYLDQETELLEEWEGKRRRAAKGSLERANRLAEAAIEALESLLDISERDRAWPMMEGLYVRIAADARTELNRTRTRVASLGSELTMSAETTTSVSTS